MGNLNQLIRLDLWDNELTGPIPPELGNLTKIFLLPLDVENMSGDIPAGWDSLESLRVVKIS